MSRMAWRRPASYSGGAIGPSPLATGCKMGFFRERSTALSSTNFQISISWGESLTFQGSTTSRRDLHRPGEPLASRVPDTIRGKLALYYHHLFGKHSGELAIMSLPQTPSRLSSATRRSPRGTSTPSTLSAKNSARVYCARKSTRQPLAPRLPPKRHARWAT